MSRVGLLLMLWLSGGRNVHCEHDHFWGHRGHLIAEAVGVDAVHVRCECVFAGAFALALVDLFVVRASDLKSTRANSP